ncbi:MULTISPECIES: response regulator [unclassified Paenibacillus]|uniref:response regulator n=1 Tax=unclassified Paenibacillus TaxID=185978 RepID=UPI0030F6A853
MLRIIIVDDEVLIREGLARMISRESPEFHIIRTYADGRHLLDELPSLQFDVVITDIRMPQTGGLELIRQLRVSRPQVRSLLMSGFVEFDYAREAIRSSAVDYLLKPINKEQLFEILYQLDKERTLLREQEERQRTGMLLSILHMAEPPGLLLASLHLPAPYFSVLLLKGDSPEAVRACAEQLRQHKPECFDVLELRRGLQAWVWYAAQPLTPDQLQEIREHLHTAASGHILHVGISRPYADAARLGDAYLEARMACDQGMYQSRLLYYATVDELMLPEKTRAEPVAAYRDLLVHDLQILNIEGIQAGLHQLFSGLAEERVSPAQIPGICREIEALARKELPEFEAVYRKGAALSLEEQIADCMRFADMETLFAASFSAALISIRAQRLELSGTAIETVKRWISAHYNQHADLNTLAGMVYLTPSYLSKLFKQVTGLTLTDYMIEIRIRKAKQLLKNAPDLKIHEIGVEVGYPDPAYFNKLFKKVVGVTPNEFKRISPVE